MQLYKSFLKQLVRNYMIGSIAAVLVVGGVLLVTTLEISFEEGARLMIILAISFMIMSVSELSVFLKQLKPIRAVFEEENPDLDLLEKAYLHVHRMPRLRLSHIRPPSARAVAAGHPPDLMDDGAGEAELSCLLHMACVTWSRSPCKLPCHDRVLPDDCRHTPADQGNKAECAVEVWCRFLAGRACIHGDSHQIFAQHDAHRHISALSVLAGRPD